ncbi:MAG: DUF3305 domain-containing protein [Pseudomonadota bacterium]
MNEIVRPAVEPVVSERYETIGVGVVMRRQPGRTRWQRWIWRVTAILPGAAPAAWRLMRREEVAGGEAEEYHAATLPVTLWRKETEAYRVALAADPPTAYVVLRPNEGQAPEAYPLVPFCVTASPFEAQDYADSGEEQVEPVPMPPAMIGWVSAFIDRHHVEEAFRKRRRDRVEMAAEDGRGDVRVTGASDVFGSPSRRREALGQGGSAPEDPEEEGGTGGGAGGGTGGETMH